MENNLIQQFTNNIFGNVRSILVNGEPWFVGSDVAKCLGYVRPDHAINNHVYDEDKIGYVLNRYGTSGGNPNVIIINESGLYSLILKSNMPAAREFQHWITSEVLPTMRKIGFDNALYILQQEVARLKSSLGNAEMSLSLKENEKSYTYYWIIRNPNIPLEDKISAFYYDTDPDGVIGIDVAQEVRNFANAYNIRL